MVAQAHEYAATKLGRAANERGTPMPGRPPKAARAPIVAIIDSAVCGAEIPDESLLVDHDGGVANAVVVVRGVAAGAAAERSEALIDNARCRFAPRVQVVTRGQSVRVRSS